MSLKTIRFLCTYSLFAISLLRVVPAFSAPGGGGFAFQLPIEFRTRSESVNGSGATTTQYLNMIPSLGYQYSDTLYFGVNYRYTNETGSTEYKGGVYGPTVSFTASNFNLAIAYYVGGSLVKSNAGTDTTYKNGTGPQFSIAYLFPATGSFAWGPEFAYSDIKYSSTETGGSTTSSTYEISGIEPYLGLFFYF